jgi:transposase-like protein
MANREYYDKLTTGERQNRYFSEDFKRKKVKEIERDLITVSEISRQYEVTRTAVYKWMHKYSRMHKKKVRMIVESKSETRKLQSLKEQIKELEQLIGQKQIKIDFLEKMIELAEGEYRIKIKKKVYSQPYDGSGSIEKNTRTK